MDKPLPGSIRTHQVFNQVSQLADYNLFLGDPVALTYLKDRGAQTEELADLGSWLGTPEAIELGRLANTYEPRLRSHDASGHRIDEVEFHPSYHQLMRKTISAGIASFPEKSNLDRNYHLKRAVGMYLISQNEAGHGCPVSMTYAAVPALRNNPGLSQLYEPLLRSHEYAAELGSLATKRSMTAGMGMTEKQGGSDVRANTTVAVATDGPESIITGHKWFCSAPMSDIFLILAQDQSGLSCYLVPRVLEDGTRNHFAIQRLKDKLGNRSNASCEVEFDNTVGYLVGEPGRGVKTIFEMVGFCRFDSMLGSAAQMRQALVQALHYARNRMAFGSALMDHDLMQNVLVDLTIESEAATLAFLRLAESDDNASSDFEAAFRRIALAVLKFLICKRAPGYMAEALECLGGNGYVEDSITARLFRESALNGIWEGSGNVNALDVLRAMGKEPQSTEALVKELDEGRGVDIHYDTALEALKSDLVRLDNPQWIARAIVERMGLLLQGALMLKYSSTLNAAIFCDSRLGQYRGSVYGTLGSNRNSKAILESAFARLD